MDEGEFGRTPKVQSATPWPPALASVSRVLAGGGIRGGALYGKSDKVAAYHEGDPLHPQDAQATVLHASVFPCMTPPG